MELKKIKLAAYFFMGFIAEIFLVADNEFSNLPESHMKYFESKTQQQHCFKGQDCKGKDTSEKYRKNNQPCWGYEKNCKSKKGFSYPACDYHDARWANSIKDQQKIFWEQGDFGYLKNFLDSMMNLCVPQNKGDSSLRCASNLVFCHATNIFMDFKNLKTATSTDRFKEDVFKIGDIGGHCKFDKDLHHKQGAHKSPLQSWFAELENYTPLAKRPSDDGSCDLVIDKPTFFIKLDAGINMYHHFCDFVNLYASQHMNGSFSTDVHIVMWDTSPYGYGDFFADTWKAFTDYPIINLKEYENKKVCFRDAVFPLLARMMRGLYYNIPLVPGCGRSGLFKAFSEHVLHRLAVPQDPFEEDVYRVTLLARKTQFRNILNQDELIGAMKRYRYLNVSVVEYNMSYPFLEQLYVTRNSDIFIGMHGAGLTHLLFLPDWAVVFELYNTEDPNCYNDLARMRGIKYITWQNRDQLFQQDKGKHPTLGEHSKFTNYAFNVEEFMRLIFEAVDSVRANRTLNTNQ